MVQNSHVGWEIIAAIFGEYNLPHLLKRRVCWEIRQT